MLTRIARHLAAAHRLRSRLDDQAISPQAADAVLDSSGRVHHARGAARDISQRDLLRRAVLLKDHARGPRGRKDSLQATKQWQAFVGKGWTLVDHFDRDGRRYVLAIDNRPQSSGVGLLSEREREVVQKALLGRTNKAIADQLGLAQSTVRVFMARAAAKVGARSRRELLQKAASLVAVPALSLRGRDKPAR